MLVYQSVLKKNLQEKNIIILNPFLVDIQDMVVSKNRGTPKWMVYNGKPCQNS